MLNGSKEHINRECWRSGCEETFNKDCFHILHPKLQAYLKQRNIKQVHQSNIYL